MTDTKPEDSKAEAAVKAQSKVVEVAQTDLAKANQALTDAQAFVQEKEAKVEEAKAKLQESLPPRLYFVYDRDTILEAETIKDNDDGTKDLLVSGVQTQKFSSPSSSGSFNPPSNKEFLRVRGGTARSDVGSYFIE